MRATSLSRVFFAVGTVWTMIWPNSSVEMSGPSRDLQLEVHGTTDRLLADGARGHLHVLFADGADHVAGGEIRRGDFVRINQTRIA